MDLRTGLTALALMAASLVAPLGLAQGATAGAAAEQAPQFRLEASDPEQLLPRAAAGREALRLAGDDLDTAATVNRMLPDALRELLLEDPTATLDRGGKVYYRDDLSARSRPDAAVPAARYPLDQTFALHSKPGSQRVIYLDFDGATVTGTSWNDQDGLAGGTFLGYSLDADRTTFSATEREVVQDVWQRVSEDFSPFDVDVTTQEPPASDITRSNGSDQRFGTRAVITDDRRPLDAICPGGCTGVAYLDVFADTRDHAYFQPAWAFTADYNDAYSIAETISHEVGHQFDLEHDGKGGEAYYGGHGIWTPIMGSGYGRPVVQWSNGAYAGATSTQDDVATIAQNGAPLRADEAGGTVATAGTSLPPSGGVISTRTDVDMYRLGTCTGAVTVTAATAPRSPDLDIELTVVDQTGARLASANPASGQGDGVTASGMGASLTYDATGQTLYAAVDGVGNGTASTGYDDYGSLGQYTLTSSGCSASTAPGAAQSVVATATSTSVTVTWAPPASDGGSAVTRYVVELSGRPSQEVAASARSATFTGLAPSTAYTATVRAVNAVGTGAGTSASTTTTSGGSTTTAPSTPRDLAVIWDADEAGLDASWSAPSSDGGSPVTGYEVFVDGVSVGTTQDSRTLVTGDYVAGQTYLVEVAARNVVGSSPRASASVRVPDVPEATVPGPPVMGTAKPGAYGGARTVSVTWSAPADDGGSPVTAYQVLVHKVGPSREIVRTYTPSPVSAERRKMSYRVAKGRYAFQVVATNAAGESEASDYSYIVKAR